MSRQLLGPLELGTLEPLVAGTAVVTSLLWLAAAAFLYALRAPPRPEPGPATLDLGPESPALANFLVNGFEVTSEAVPATVLDLAARRVVEIEQRGPEVFFVRLRSSPDDLTDYERRVLGHLESRARAGVVPVEALTTGGPLESKGWRQAFREEVVADAQARGLSRDALGSSAFAALAVGAMIPAACALSVWGFAPGAGVLVAAALCLSWIRRRHPQRETAAGLYAASRWLGVRAELASNEEFARHSPLTVTLWDRLLAYGAALGVASGAARALPLGVESDTRAWTFRGDRWQELRVSYPRVWPPAWGSEPAVAFGTGLAIVVASVIALQSLGAEVADAGGSAVVVVVALAGGVVLGLGTAVVGAADWKTSREVTGPIVRKRAFENDRKSRFYLAVDDGTSTRIRAFRVSRAQFEGVDQGDVVTVRTTPRLGRVRWIIAASGAV